MASSKLTQLIDFVSSGVLFFKAKMLRLKKAKKRKVIFFITNGFSEFAYKVNLFYVAMLFPKIVPVRILPI